MRVACLLLKPEFENAPRRFYTNQRQLLTFDNSNTRDQSSDPLGSMVAYHENDDAINPSTRIGHTHFQQFFSQSGNYDEECLQRLLHTQ